MEDSSPHIPVIHVPAHVTALIEKLLSGVPPKEPDLRRPQHVQWGNYSTSETDLISEVKRDEYRICHHADLEWMALPVEAEDTWCAPLVVDFADNSKLKAKQTFRINITTSGGESSRPLVARYWKWYREPIGQPLLWFGVVSGSFSVVRGNVQFSAPNLLDYPLRLEGSYIYYIGKRSIQQCEFYLIVDTNGEPLDDKELYADFLILQFLLGQRLRLDRLVGIDQSGAVVAVIGHKFGEDHPEYALRSPPIPLWESHAIVPFFSALSSAYKEHPEWDLFIPLGYYLDSLCTHIDGGYLAIHVGLEAFALRLLLSGEESKTKKKKLKDKLKKGVPIVKDKEWRQWVNDHKGEIESLAEPGREEIFLQQVLTSGHLSSGSIVKAAFDQFSLDLISDMEKELKERNLVAHEALMNRINTDRDARRDRQRQAMVRTMLVALLAKAVGFKGEIQGWERKGNSGYILAPSNWWKVDTDAVMVQYLASRSAGSAQDSPSGQ